MKKVKVVRQVMLWVRTGSEEEQSDCRADGGEAQQINGISLGLALVSRAIALGVLPMVLAAVGGLSGVQRAIANETTPVDAEAEAALEVAAVPPVLNLRQAPLEMDLLASTRDLSQRGIVTNRTISQTELTTPSLWWTRDQFGGKLLEHWLAYSGVDGSPRRVDLIVDRQLWGLSTYLERYTFVNRFGSAAKDFGYSIRVFNDHGEPLATYICSFPDLPSVETLAASTSRLNVSDVSCNIGLDSSGAGALRGRSNSFDLFF